MTEVPAEPNLAADKAAIETLVKQLEDLKKKYEAEKGPNKRQKIVASVLAAITSSEAIKVEKSVAVLAIARIVLFAPSLAVYADLISKALGGPSVKG